jgi:hypothetical protein
MGVWRVELGMWMSEELCGRGIGGAEEVYL